MAEWKRPDSVPFPHTYLEFDGRIERNGKVNKYWIQELTEEYIEDVVHYYVNGFLRDEPISKCANCHDDPLCLVEMADFWRHTLKLKISLICLTKDDNGTIKIVGFNTLLPRFKIEPESSVKSPTTKKIYGVLQYAEKQKDVFADFNCDVYLGAMGLFVLSEFRGEGIGEKILSMREKVGKLMGFKLGCTVYTSPISAKQAAKVGFKDYSTVAYADIGKADSSLALPGIEKYSVQAKYMYQLYD